MDDERWQRLKKATWFMKEQEEVTAYVEELRALLADEDGKVECPDCGKTEAVRSIEEITEHLGGPEDGGIFDFDYTFKAPVFTCPCGYAWTGHEREVASTEARRLEVEKRYRLKVLEERRRDAATAKSVTRMFAYIADGLGIWSGYVGGFEAAVLSLAVEAKAQREAHHTVKDHANELGHKYGELQKLHGELQKLHATSELVTDTRFKTMLLICAEGLGVDVNELGKNGTESAIIRLVTEVESLRGFKNSVDEALNSGDGTYRP